MACENCIDPNAEIRDCPPYANREDVISLLKEIGTRSCCLGILSEPLNPTNPDEVVEAFDQAFPDGVTACVCDCLHIIYHDVENDIFKTYQNCHGSNNWLNPSAWCDDCGGMNCMGHLTTVGLDPSANPVSAAQSVEEAFPEGLQCPRCETAIIYRADGNLCHSIDCGESWDCSTSENSGIYILQSGLVTTGCTGCAGTLPCTTTRILPLMVFSSSPEQDVLNGNAEENQTGILLDCILCNNSARVDFRVNETRTWRVRIAGRHVGNFALGSSGCSECGQTGSQNVVLRLKDEIGTILVSKALGTDFGDSSKDSAPFNFDLLLQLDTSKEYFWEATFIALHSGCCPPDCGMPTYDVRGSIAVTNFSVEGA